jgi:phenylpropionate dioxygenase-like ring-hydroxylating dioxygenase large terminal subunit
VEQLVGAYQLEQVLPVEGSRFRIERPYNWKIIHDIDNEGYHVPVGHPALQQLYGKHYRDTEIGGIPVSMAELNEEPAKLWSVRRYQKLLPTYDHLADNLQRTWNYVAIFPSMVITLYPDSVGFYMTLPLGIDSTLYLGAAYARPDDRREARAARYLNQRINRDTDAEDEDFVRWMQEGMNSSAFPQQQLSSLEHGVRGFHRSIQARIPAARLTRAPQAGSVADVNRKMLRAVSR